MKCEYCERDATKRIIFNDNPYQVCFICRQFYLNLGARDHAD